MKLETWSRAFASYDAALNIKFKDEYEMYSQRFGKDDFKGDAYDPTVLPNSYLTHPDATKTFLYKCTIQRLALLHHTLLGILVNTFSINPCNKPLMNMLFAP